MLPPSVNSDVMDTHICKKTFLSRFYLSALFNGINIIFTLLPGIIAELLPINEISVMADFICILRKFPKGARGTTQDRDSHPHGYQNCKKKFGGTPKQGFSHTTRLC